MSAAPTVPFVSIESYLSTSYEPNCEYLDGRLLPKSMPDYLHSKLQALILLLLGTAGRDLGIEVLAEVHLRVTGNRFRVPDVAGLTAAPMDGRYPDSRTPPLFTIEIVSQDESWSSLRGKVSDHLAVGVSVVILADPHSKSVMVATPDEPLHELRSPLLLDVPVPGGAVLQIDFDRLYSQL